MNHAYVHVEALLTFEAKGHRPIKGAKPCSQWNQLRHNQVIVASEVTESGQYYRLAPILNGFTSKLYKRGIIFQDDQNEWQQPYVLTKTT